MSTSTTLVVARGEEVRDVASSTSPQSTLLPASCFRLQLPDRLLRANNAARTWLRLHARTLNTLADLLRSIPFLTRSPHAEYHSALLSALFVLLRLYRDYPPAPTTAGTSSAPLRDRRAGRRVLLLEILRAIELPLEMAVSRSAVPPRAAPTHLQTVTAIEASKAALKLSLLSADRPQTLSDITLPESPPPPPPCTCGLADIPEAADVTLVKGPRTDRAILALRAARRRAVTRPRRRLSRAVIAGLSPPPSASSLIAPHNNNSNNGSGDPDDGGDPLLDALFVVAYERRSNWLLRLFLPDARCAACDGALTLPPRPPVAESVAAAGDIVSSLSATEVIAEVAYIARPVMHLLLVRRLGWTSWRAWGFALLLDVAARLAVPAPTDGPARIERRRRLALLLLYLGRSPLFDIILRAVIRRLTNPLRRVPVVGGLAAAVVQWGTLLQQYWFYTSGS